MTQTEFIDQFAEILGVSPGQLTSETELASIENWDSVAYLAAIVLIDEKLGLALRPDVLSRARTLQDVVDVVKDRFQQ